MTNPTNSADGDVVNLLDAVWELQRQLTGLSLNILTPSGKIIRKLADDALLIHAEIRRQQSAKSAQQSSDQGSGEVDEPSGETK